MIYESLQPVTFWLHTDLPEPRTIGAGGHLLFPLLFSFNVGLGVVGATAAVIVALWLSIRKACLPFTKQFPEMSFVTAPAELVRTVGSLSRRAGILTPRVSLIDSGDPAAFITWSGREYVLVISVGLLESLSHDELAACIAHEISHVKNNDFPVRSFATTVRVALFAHPLSHLIEPALYRAREFLADKTAVQIIGGRDSLVSALTKIRESQDYITSQPGSIATACLFNPASNTRFVRLFDKHPSLDSRIKALKELNLIE
jgi:heat shock protein HtpX